MKRLLLHIFIFASGILSAQTRVGSIAADSLPPDLPLPTITTLKNPADGYIFAAVPYWGTGGLYLVVYNNQGRPVFYRKTPATCTDFKLHDNGLFTWFDYSSKKFFAMDSSLAVVDSFWVQNGFTTDEHEIKLLKNGNVLLIGNAIRFYDMSQVIPGGDRNASVVVNVVQEIDRSRKVVFEWKAFERYKLTDVGPAVNLLDPAFVHSHLNSIDLDLDSNLVVSSRTLDEITKIDRKSGNMIWRLGGKNNQFRFLNDSVGFSAQHSVSVLPNGNLLLFDNGLFHKPHFSRAAEYKIDAVNKTATLVWSYRNTPDVASIFWGNAQRLKNGNTFISWGKSEIGATEVDSKGEKVFEMKFPTDVFSYRMFRFPVSLKGVISHVEQDPVPSEFRLEQNFPNPFNGTTAVSYQLPALSEPRSLGRVEGTVFSSVTLKVFDVMGREVAVLVDTEQAPGIHKVHFAPDNLPSGIYIYRLQAGNVSKAGRMLYLK